MPYPYNPDAPCHLFTIGHSTNTVDQFIARLQQNGVKVLVDVRSSPYSHYNAQFNREPFAAALHHAGIDYYYGGSVLGGKSDRSVKDAEFVQKMGRIVQLIATEGKTAMMCAEKNPADCHRATKLAAWVIRQPEPLTVRHILIDGSTVDARAFEAKIKERDGWWELFPLGEFGKPAAPNPKQEGLF
jgi:uncharacterized protein (DUF488 family)